MSLVGTALGRMAYGAGQISNKYIDQEIETQKMQAMADIQRASNIAMDQYTNSPERRGRMRTEATADTIAAGAAKDRVDLATATNDPLNTALDARAKARTRAVAESTPHTLSPGQEVILGPGSNSRKTPAELSLEAYREGVKGAKKEDRDRMTEAHLSGLNNQIKDVQSQITKGMAEGTLTNVRPEDGKPNNAYNAFQYLQQEMNRLEGARAAIILASREGGGGITIRGLDEKPGMTEDQSSDARLRKGAGPSGPMPREAARALESEGAAAPPPMPASGTIDRSLAGRAKRREQAEQVAARDREAAAAKDATAKQQAQAAFEAINGDKRAAFKLQGSGLFKHLTPEQQLEIHSLVNR